MGVLHPRWHGGHGRLHRAGKCVARWHLGCDLGCGTVWAYSIPCSCACCHAVQVAGIMISDVTEASASNRLNEGSWSHVGVTERRQALAQDTLDWPLDGFLDEIMLEPGRVAV